MIIKENGKYKDRALRGNLTYGPTSALSGCWLFAAIRAGTYSAYKAREEGYEFQMEQF